MATPRSQLWVHSDTKTFLEKLKQKGECIDDVIVRLIDGNNGSNRKFIKENQISKS